MAMTPMNSASVVVIDASVLVSIVSIEIETHVAAKKAFTEYTLSGAEFFAPSVMVGKVIYALCKKVEAKELTEAEHTEAIKSFEDFMTKIAVQIDDNQLIKRAIEIQKSYGCSHSADSFYIALTEVLAENGSVELFTLDRGMKKQAAKNAPSVVVNVSQ